MLKRLSICLWISYRRICLILCGFCIDMNVFQVLNAYDNAANSFTCIFKSFNSRSLESFRTPHISLLPLDKGKLPASLRIRPTLGRYLLVAGVIIAICAAALAVGITLGLRRNCSTAKEPSSLIVDFHSTNTTISWISAEENEGCNVTYFLRYHMDEDPKMFEVNTTETIYVIDYLSPCTVLHIHLWAISETGKMSEGHYMKNFIEYPGEIGSVQDVSVEVENDNVATVAWYPPLGLDLCNIEYKVSATNEDLNGNQWDTCNGSSSCAITLSDFCPLTIFSIVATSIDDTAVAEAEEVIFIFDCESF